MEWTSIVPVIDFTFNNSGTCSGTHNFQSFCIWDNPFTYLWDFGDGGSATAKNPSILIQHWVAVFKKFYCSTKSYEYRNGLSNTIRLSVQQNQILNL
jgi:hypothetical protein